MYRRSEAVKLWSQLIREFVNHSWTDITVKTAGWASAWLSRLLKRTDAHCRPHLERRMIHYETSNAEAVRNDFMQNRYRQRADVGAEMDGVTSHIDLTVTLTLNSLTWKIWWAPNNASSLQMGFNSAFKGLNTPKNWKSYFSELQWSASTCHCTRHIVLQKGVSYSCIHSSPQY